MIFAYGAYRHAQNEVSYTVTGRPLKSDGGIYYAVDYRYLCFGLLHSPDGTQQGLTRAIDGLLNAYSVDGYDLVHYLDDGITPTAHQLQSANCNGGTRIVQAPSFANTYGTAEYSTYRTYQFAVAGEVPLTANNVLLHYNERLATEGTGGPIKVFIPVAMGNWIRQQTSQQSTFRIVQRGSAVGLYGFPGIPAPIWPDAEIEQLRRVEQGSPTLRNGRYYNFPVTWSYTFESSGSLVGQPNFFPLS